MEIRKANNDDREAINELYNSVKNTQFCTWNEYYPTLAVHLLCAANNPPANKTYLKSGYKKCGEVFMYGNNYNAYEKTAE